MSDKPSTPVSTEERNALYKGFTELEEARAALHRLQKWPLNTRKIQHTEKQGTKYQNTIPERKED